MTFLRAFCAYFVASALFCCCTYARTEVLLNIQGDAVVAREATEISVRVETARGVSTILLDRAQITRAHAHRRTSFRLCFRSHRATGVAVTPSTSRRARSKARYPESQQLALPQYWHATACDRPSSSAVWSRCLCGFCRVAVATHCNDACRVLVWLQSVANKMSCPWRMCPTPAQRTRPPTAARWSMALSPPMAARTAVIQVFICAAPSVCRMVI